MNSRAHPALRLLLCGLGVMLVHLLVGQVFESARHFAVTLSTNRGAAAAAAAAAAQPTPAEFLFLQLFSCPALIGWVWFCRHTFDGLSLRSLGLHMRRATRGFLVGALGGILALSVLCALLMLLGEVTFEWPSDFVFAGSPPQIFSTFAGYLLLFGAVAFFEELLFRGYVLHNLATMFGVRVAVLGQAAFFALAHFGNVGVRGVGWFGTLNLVLIAIFFALSYRKTGSLWFPIGFHAAWNFFLGCVFSLPVSGLPTPKLLQTTVNQNLLTGGAFGPEASLLLSPVLLALCFVIWRTPDHPQTTLDLEITRTGLIPMAESSIPDVPEPEVEGERENRFRTRFGAGSPLEAQPLYVEIPSAEVPTAMTSPSDSAYQIDVREVSLSPDSSSATTLVDQTEADALTPVLRERASVQTPDDEVLASANSLTSLQSSSSSAPDVAREEPVITTTRTAPSPTETTVASPLGVVPIPDTIPSAVAPSPLVVSPPSVPAPTLSDSDPPVPSNPVPPKPKPPAPRW